MQLAVVVYYCPEHLGHKLGALHQLRWYQSHMLVPFYVDLVVQLQVDPVRVPYFAYVN